MIKWVRIQMLKLEGAWILWNLKRAVKRANENSDRNVN